MQIKHKAILTLIALMTFHSAVAELPEMTGDVVTRTTPSGTRFGLWGTNVQYPAPTLFVFSASIEEALGDSYFRQCGNELAEAGYLCVSIDLPGHGLAQHQNEPGELDTWRFRSDKGVNFVTPFTTQVKHVIDHLIAAGYTDADRIATCGTSRGGFMAIHAAAEDHRIRATAAFAPVTNLATLRHFRSATNPDHIKQLSLNALSGALSGRSLWLVIGDRDDGVGTDDTISFARLTTKASLASGKTADVTLHVLPEPKGHTTPGGSTSMAAQWIKARIQ